MTTKWTKGPWQTVVKGSRLSVWAEGFGYIHTAEEVGDPKTADANAQLIASAPDLYEALEAIRDSAMGRQIPIWLVGRLVQAEAALRSARGEK